MQGQATTRPDQVVKAPTPQTHPVARRIERDAHTAGDGEEVAAAKILCQGDGRTSELRGGGR